MTRRKRRPVVFKRDIRFGKQTRIRIPQTPLRPLKLHQRSLIREEFVREDPWWWQLHRTGVSRKRVGLDPLEARAVPKERVRGSLPERILYRALIAVMRFSPETDFNFQSSLQGGRLELGGMVADFLFFWMRIVIRVQGPGHDEYLRMRKDEEQRDILISMGFEVYDIEDRIIYDEYTLENWLRRTFGLRGRGGAGSAHGEHSQDDEPVLESEYIELIWAGLQEASQSIDNVVATFISGLY